MVRSDFNVIVCRRQKLFCDKDVYASMANVVASYVDGATGKLDCRDCNKRFIRETS